MSARQHELLVQNPTARPATSCMKDSIRHQPRRTRLKEVLWMDEILHHFETMRNDYRLVFAGESSFQCFSGGANWISSIHSSIDFRHPTLLQFDVSEIGKEPLHASPPFGLVPPRDPQEPEGEIWGKGTQDQKRPPARPD